VYRKDAEHVKKTNGPFLRFFACLASLREMIFPALANFLSQICRMASVGLPRYYWITIV